MKYDPIDSKLFQKNRAKFVAQMKPGSVAIFNSNEVFQTGCDGVLPFTQHGDIFYLSGIDQEKSILVLFPDAFEKECREMLFIIKSNPHIFVWEGYKLTKKDATDISGIASVHHLEDLSPMMEKVMAQAERLYVNTNEHLRRTETCETKEEQFFKGFREKYPIHKLERSAPILHRIRSIKEPEEIELIARACSITEIGFRTALTTVRDKVPEYEIEATFLYEFVKNRSKGFAYNPIVANGKNSCILHYLENNRVCKNGDVLLLDVGAEYANYKSDMTRTIPVSGKFSERQAAVYRSVLAVKKYAESILNSGIYLHDYHQKIENFMQEQLLSLGLISSQDVKNAPKENPAYKKYFMHGTSHFIGLDVHDSGLWNEPIKDDMVFTIEPGIYIPEENFGVRLEDVYVVQKNAPPTNLMKNIPLEIEEIENIMAQSKK